MKFLFLYFIGIIFSLKNKNKLIFDDDLYIRMKEL